MVRRGGIWQFRRHVPDAVRALDRRRDVRLSTGTGDRTKATLAVAHFNAALKAHWASLGTQQLDHGASTRVSAAVERYAPVAAIDKARGDRAITGRFPDTAGIAVAARETCIATRCKPARWMPLHIDVCRIAASCCRIPVVRNGEKIVDVMVRSPVRPNWR